MEMDDLVGSVTACYGSSMGSNPDFSKKYKMGHTSSLRCKGLVALPETFLLLRALLILLKESLGRSKPTTNLNTSTITHCVGFLLYPSLTEPSSKIK
jgi:hypothetical protein